MLWNVVNPLAMLAVYAFILTQMLSARPGSPDRAQLSFPLYVASGFLPWVTFSEGMVRSTQTFLTNAAYLKKLPIPEIVFVAQSGVSALLSMLIAIVLLPGLALVLGHPPSWAWLLLPLVVLVWQVFGFGLGLALSSVNVFFRDTGQILSVLLQIWMWSVPIIYFEEMLPAAYRATLPFNPVYPFVTALRGAFLGDGVEAWMWLGMTGWAAAALVVGLLVLRVLEGEIRDFL